jgi:hypothetical protein
VIEACIDEELRRVCANPRASASVEGLGAALAQRTGDLRLLVQRALSLRSLPSEARQGTSRRPGDARVAFGYGYHPEVELAPASLGWVGYADAVRLSPDACDIVDYKTGSPSPAHADQLRVYALLWARDAAINPPGRLADRLVLVYPGGTHEVPAPSACELDALESSLRERGAAALSALRQKPPPAAVAPETCRFCDVKALCSDYWTPAGQTRLAVTPTPPYRSLQVVIAESLTRVTAVVVIEIDSALPPGTRAVLAHADGVRPVVGDRIRLVDVLVASEPDVAMPVISPGRQSEVFRVP